MIPLSYVVWLVLPIVLLVAVLLACGRCRKKKKQEPQPLNVQSPVVVIPRQSSPPQSDASSSEEEKMWESLRREFLKSAIKKASKQKVSARQVAIIGSANVGEDTAGRKSVKSMTDSPQMESYSLPEEESNESAVVKSASEDLEDQEESTITPTKTYYSFHHCH